MLGHTETPDALSKRFVARQGAPGFYVQAKMQAHKLAAVG
jgi:hypothetical protein